VEEVDLWQYEGPPRPLDLVHNNLFSNGARLVLHLLLRLYLRACHDYRCRGAATLVTDGPALIVANHASHLDVAALFSAFPLSAVNRVRALAAKDYFFRSGLMRAVGFFIANAVPLDRQRLEAALVSYCREVVSAGGSVIVFPEGTRSPDGRLRPFRPGVGMLAKALGVRVVPACIRGTFACLPKGTCRPRCRPVAVEFAEPMNFADVEDSRAGWDAIAERLHRRIAEMAPSDASAVPRRA